MLRSTIVWTVASCARHAWLVALAAAVLAVVSCVYTVRHFAITTDASKLIATANGPGQQTSQQAFPEDKMLVVVQAPTPELVDQATDRLAKALPGRAELFRSISQTGGGEFFQRNGLLFLPPQDVERTMGELTMAKPMLGVLASDPSLRGIADTLSFAVAGARQGQLKLDDLTRPLTLGADTLDDVLAGRPASFSWRVLVQGRPATPQELRRFIEIQPILNFAALEPGEAATAAIRQAASDLKLASDLHASVRLTGQVPIDDEEFAILREHAVVDIAATILTVLVVLWLALRSLRIILAVVFALVVGLSTTAAFGLLTVGSFNLISIAFAVLFIGLGVDFGLQFSVRYRSERHDIDNLRLALSNAAKKAGIPLALAAAGTTAGFFSFLPTAFRGLSELGQIAGSGMLIAFVTTITVLPAALTILRPPAEPHQMGFAKLAPLDRFMMRHRIAIVVLTIAAVLCASPLLLRVKFDFNPMHLQNPNAESVATFLELQDDPNLGANAVNIMAPSLAGASAVAARLAALPQVSRAMTLESFIPDAQDQKLAAIQHAAAALDTTIKPANIRPAPSDAETVQALESAATGLSQVAGEDKGAGATAARRLSALLSRLAAAPPALRVKADQVLVPPLKFELDQLRLMLKAQKIIRETLPSDLTRNWIGANGAARVQVLPRGDSNDDTTLRTFASAVLAVEPTATGAPVSLQAAADMVVRAFFEAGTLALVSIAVLLWIALRRLGDVLLTLVPLILAGLVTLEISVLIGLPLNFANIIALPLLLGVGVAFKIYYIMAWRAGKTNLLESTLTRAVIFSAMTTATAFGSLWLSEQPGIASMGKLMALSLACTLAAAVLFQPVLMGPPRGSAVRDSRAGRDIDANAGTASAAEIMTTTGLDVGGRSQD